MVDVFLQVRTDEVRQLKEIINKTEWPRTHPERLTKEWKHLALTAYIREGINGWLESITCPHCPAPKTPQSYSCRACSNALPGKKKKIKQTCIQKFGAAGVLSHPKVRAKFQKTMQERYGVNYAGESRELVLKGQRTHRARTGVNTHMQTQDAKKAHQNRYKDRAWVERGVAKAQNTKREKYGEDWSRQSTEAMMKARYKFKTVKLAGVSYEVLGYEPVAIKWLLSKGLSEANIAPNPGAVPYVDSKGVHRQYRPDLKVKIKSTHYHVEVKSNYTAGLIGKRGAENWRQLQAKANGVFDKTGFPLKVLICSDKKVLCVFHDVSSLSLKQARSSYQESLMRSLGRS